MKILLKSIQQNWVLILLVQIHIAGLIGLNLEISKLYFQNLIWFNLVLTNILLFFKEQELKNKKLVFVMILIAILGYLVEVLGVKTKLIFGEYTYQNTMGIKLFDVPLLIGLNWLMLVYCTAHIAEKMSQNYWLKCFFGAFLMVLLDICIEPFAIKFDMWSWQNNTIPIQNYIGWYITSFLLLALFFKVKFKKNNYQISSNLYIIQLLFFVANYILR